MKCQNKSKLSFKVTKTVFASWWTLPWKPCYARYKTENGYIWPKWNINVMLHGIYIYQSVKITKKITPFISNCKASLITWGISLLWWYGTSAVELQLKSPSKRQRTSSLFLAKSNTFRDTISKLSVNVEYSSFIPFFSRFARLNCLNRLNISVTMLPLVCKR